MYAQNTSIFSCLTLIRPTLHHPILIPPTLPHPTLPHPAHTPPSFAPPSPLPPSLTSSHLKQMVRLLHLNVHFLLLLLLLPFIPSSAQLVNGGTVLGQEVDRLGPPGLYPDLRTNTSLLQVELHSKGRRGMGRGDRGGGRKRGEGEGGRGEGTSMLQRVQTYPLVCVCLHV